MSACMSYRRITLEELHFLLSNSGQINDWVAQDYEGPGRESRRHLHFDTDVAWHMLHYIMNGEALGGHKPLWNAVMGGTPINSSEMIKEDRPGHFVTDLDVLWEGFRYLTPYEVVDTFQAMTSLDKNVMESRCNKDEMLAHDIYSVPLREEYVVRLVDDMLDLYTFLCKYFQEAVDDHNAMLIWLS
jgi:uncharacterized protein DUF1877